LMLTGCSSSTVYQKEEIPPIPANLKEPCKKGLPLLKDGSRNSILTNRKDTFFQYETCRKRHQRLIEAIPVSKALVITDKSQLALIIERNKGTGWPDLTAQRKAFAMHFLMDYDHRAAAVEVKFSEAMGAKLIREPLLSAYISELQNQDLISNIVTEDFVRTQWLNLIPILSGQVEVPLGVDADGDQLNGKKFMASELNNVLKELAKSTKFYEEGSGDGSVNVQINVAALLGNTEVKNV